MHKEKHLADDKVPHFHGAMNEEYGQQLVIAFMLAALLFDEE
ncbi:hypothetical protein ABE321_11200 [Bacillus paralicheniformis]|nr:hypothetical protein [Bacillus paralicheniformis]MCU4667000.1 hypothetical protein [Bacillus paralicheniformis]MEC1822318.1 hypothetical protein [Bacillus paralicheniformis]TWK27994.1 hypothetical protein CHCC20372_3245 [Bacillus paralicheniformis]TWK86918.1 hypothetical protein CHCC20331_2279 [Bacillus paralicheniformis]